MLGDAELTTRSWDDGDRNITSNHWSVGRASWKIQSVVRVIGRIRPGDAASKRNAFGGSACFDMPVVLGTSQITRLFTTTSLSSFGHAGKWRSGGIVFRGTGRGMSKLGRHHNRLRVLDGVTRGRRHFASSSWLAALDVWVIVRHRFQFIVILRPVCSARGKTFTRPRGQSEPKTRSRLERQHI